MHTLTLGVKQIKIKSEILGWGDRLLGSLHWLPVTFRIDFKVLLLVYKSLNGLGPKYIADVLIEYKDHSDQ